MGKPITNPPKDPLERLPGWHKEVLDEHFKGLPGLYVRRLLDEASAAERSAQGKHSAVKRHEARNKIKDAQAGGKAGEPADRLRSALRHCVCAHRADRWPTGAGLPRNLVALRTVWQSTAAREDRARHHRMARR